MLFLILLKLKICLDGGTKEEEKYITTEPDEESKIHRNDSENSIKILKEKPHESIFKAKVEAGIFLFP